MNKLLVLSFVVTMIAIVPAEALYVGAPLHAGAGYVFRIADASNGSAVTLLSVTRGRLEVEDTAVVPAGDGLDIPLVVSQRTTRVMLKLDLQCAGDDPSTGCGQITVTVLDATGNTVVAPRVLREGNHFEYVCDVTP
jgi:hypothetical protein